ncbi:unnamed protein product [Phaedon cochleariae]|uniref:Uncharacterized protein n=1 Tax=Phaedon cochleariae TaxID=80249 RepID=A0A9N9X2E0_PHACE|nr:unnamed protein product [Phaedon cochleariae]
MRHTIRILTSLAIINLTRAAPASDPSKDRRPKHFSFLDYSQPELDYPAYNIDNDDYISMALEENDLGRTIPRSKPLIRPQQYNSPIYYIRLPPQPYMYVPGLGYVSNPAPPPVSPFVNLPMSFVANGKPSNVYQWSGAFQGFPAHAQAAPPVALPKPHKQKKPLQDSTVHRLPGSFAFNGKPEDIFVLRDSYNSLLSDVLQNVYP